MARTIGPHPAHDHLTNRTHPQALAAPTPRTLLAVSAAFLLAALSLFLAAPAGAAAKSCGDRVIDDWYDNGRVDKEYPYNCYEDAIDSLPVDVKDYSSAAEDIQRALQNRLRDMPAPPASHDPSPGGGTDTTGAGPTETTDGGGTGGTGNGNGNGNGGNGGGPLNEVIDEVGPGDASSVPIPLLVLGGLALLLVAAGSAGYVARRLQARRAGPPTAPPTA
jgi:hypothetical protein